MPSLTGQTEQPVAPIGRPVATDDLVRVVLELRDIGPNSACSKVFDATAPHSLLLGSGGWEVGARRFVRAAVQMVTPNVA